MMKRIDSDKAAYQEMKTGRPACLGDAFSNRRSRTETVSEWKRLYPLRWGLSLVGLLLANAAAAVEAQRLDLGVQGGFSFVATHGETFWQAEVLAGWHLPWQWHLDSHWYVDPRMDLTAGTLTGCDQAGFVGTLGPNFFVGHDKFPLSVNLGVSPTVISRPIYDCRDFGTPFQFTSHAGIECAIGSRWRVGYRVQHMSNAGLSGSNPGLNVQMLSVSFKF